MAGAGEALALVSAAIWGTGTLMYRVALRELSPLELTFIRSISASIFLVGVALAFGSVPFGGLGSPDLALIALSGVLLFLGDILYFRCVETIGIWIATPLSSVYPLFVTGIAYLFLGEGVTAPQTMGIFLIVGGIMVLTFRSPPEEGKASSMSSSLFGLAAAFMWAISLVAIRVVLISEGLFVSTSSRGIIIVILLLMIMLTNGRMGRLRRIGLSRKVRYISFVSGAWGIGLGGLLFFYSMEFIGTAKATAISATYPLFAGFLGTLILGESLTAKKLAGAVLVVTGLVLLP
jgi:drug/metabolite transporter (DMT)-like permease